MDTSGPLLERQHSNPYAKFGCAISERAKIFWNEPEMRHKLAIRMGVLMVKCCMGVRSPINFL